MNTALEINAGSIPFHTIDWESLPLTEQKGESGIVRSRTASYGNLRVRIVEYSAGYLADHWCQKGHLIYCLKGEMVSELSDGSEHVLKEGMSYHVSDNLSSHRSRSEKGVKLLVIDGDFLNLDSK